MSRRRNGGRPRGWRDQRRAGASVPRTPDDLTLLGAPVLQGADVGIELLPWMAFKAFMDGNLNLQKAILSEPFLRLIHMHEEVLRQLPNSAVTHFHLGDLYWCAARLEDAIAEYEAALRVAPRLGGAHTRVAYCLLGLGELKRAKERLERASRAPSDKQRMDVYLAEAHLLLGHYHEGWRRQELVARYQPGRIAEIITRHVRAPFWDGRPLDEPLLIGGCDGYGDILQCVRYVPQARHRARNLTLLVQDALVPLLRGQFEGVTVLGYGAPPDPRQCAASMDDTVGDEPGAS